MKERTFIACLVTFLILGSLVATMSTDAIYVAVALGFFALCIAYAEGCSRL
jgi:NADH:ubiquinone oxidoreductase subunit 6 (subunit J)